MIDDDAEPDIDAATDTETRTDPDDATETEVAPDTPDLIDRLSLKTGLHILPELRALIAGGDFEASERVRRAVDQAIIAICGRVVRSMARDLTGAETVRR